MLRIDIGIFAHDEAAGIADLLAGLASQDILATPGIDARVIVLANGCTDATVAVARAAADGAVEVADLPQGGKSRTWNRFVHDLSRPDADVLMFCDADIEWPAPDMLRRLCQGLVAQPALQVLNSQPVKDTVHRPENLSLTDRLIAAGGGGLDDWKSAICGQLYAMPAAAARRFHLPVGLPVEDGFLRAMILTDALTEDGETLARIDGLDGVFHLYASERSIAALIRHQTRIVVGSAVNAATFAWLRHLPASERHAELARAAGDDGWLARVLRAELPQMRFGYVPWHFLTKRVLRAAETPRELLRPKRALVTVMGAGFDLIVYLAAQIRMARGTGAGFW